MRVFLLFLFSLLTFIGYGQHIPSNFSLNRFWQLEFERQNSLLENKAHTSIRPWINNSQQLAPSGDSLGTGEKSWLYRKVYREHLVDYRKEDWSIQLDPLMDLQLGGSQGGSLAVNTRGVQLQGNIGTRFAFYSSFFETQATHPDHVTNKIRSTRVAPAQGNVRDFGSRGFDYAQSVAYVSFSPNKHFNFQFGHDRHFIGDGYRSLLLSDASFPHPYFRILTDVGPFQYMYLVSQYTDLVAPRLSNQLGNRQKYSAMGYLDWRIGKRFTLGFFQAVVWQADDSTGRRGLDVNYLNPIIFLRPVEFSLGSEGNMLLGLNAKLKLSDHHLLYGQLILDEFDFSELVAQNGYWANKYGFQLGYKGFDMFGIPHLALQSEVNTVRPYTYSHWTSLTNYGQYNEPLAHPFGANFIEWVNFINYRKDRYYGQLQLMAATIGYNEAGSSAGQDIFSSYYTRSRDYGNTIGQGNTTNIFLAGLKGGYILNTQTNLRLELSLHHRQSRQASGTQNDQWIMLGLVSSIRNLYYDF